MQAVRALGLRKTFGPVVAVNDLGFEAKAGEFLTLLGVSGPTGVWKRRRWER
jgi:ABC-type Fe3+/spermidine/putrescine transport system ATPase subunit